MLLDEDSSVQERIKINFKPALSAKALDTSLLNVVTSIYIILFYNEI